MAVDAFYDGRREIIHTVMPGGGLTPTSGTQYRQYDADGRLVAEISIHAPGTYVVMANA